VDIGPTTTHDYWGAARDRIPVSGVADLDGELFDYHPTIQDTRGKRVRVAAPGNVCLIRTAQDWRRTTGYRRQFAEQVAPLKDAAARYLATQPDTGCLTARQVDEQDLAGAPLGRASTVAWFLSLEHLTTWARSHRNHLELYGKFLHMIAGNDGPLDIAFWHEVFVVPKGNGSGDYFNCHNRTGFLTLVDQPSAGPAE
jgi:phenylacetaldoxime dehydratase/aldoxime dehydratase